MPTIISRDHKHLHLIEDGIGRIFFPDGTHTYVRHQFNGVTHRWSMNDDGLLMWRENNGEEWQNMISDLDDSERWSPLVRDWLADIELLHEEEIKC